MDSSTAPTNPLCNLGQSTYSGTGSLITGSMMIRVPVPYSEHMTIWGIPVLTGAYQYARKVGYRYNCYPPQHDLLVSPSPRLTTGQPWRTNGFQRQTAMAS